MTMNKKLIMTAPFITSLLCLLLPPTGAAGDGRSSPAKSVRIPGPYTVEAAGLPSRPYEDPPGTFSVMVPDKWGVSTNPNASETIFQSRESCDLSLILEVDPDRLKPGIAALRKADPEQEPSAEGVLKRFLGNRPDIKVETAAVAGQDRAVAVRLANIVGELPVAYEVIRVAGDYWLVTWRGGEPSWPVLKTVSYSLRFPSALTPAQKGNVKLQTTPPPSLSTGTVQGVVFWRNGRTASNVFVKVAAAEQVGFASFDGTQVGPVYRPGDFVDSTYTNRQGRFKFKLPPGTYIFIPGGCRGIMTLSDKRVEVKEGDRTEIELTVAGGI